MSSGIFRSKQFKSKKNLQKLSISAPVMGSGSPTPVSSPVTSSPSVGSFPVVVLSAKYRFTATCSSEMSIRENDYIKLLERPGNGWLKVQSLDRFNKCGFVPASYVDIAVNDVVNPITLKWLYQIEDSDQQEAEVERPYPKTVNVTNVLRNTSNKFWYRVEFTLSNNERVYVGRRYQDLYNLHIQLTKINDNDFSLRLPLPPRRSVNGDGAMSPTLNEQRPLDDLRIMCRELDGYLKSVLRIGLLQKSGVMYNFFSSSPQVCELMDDESPRMSSKEINDQLHAGSVGIKELQQFSFFSSTAPLPPIETQSMLTRNTSVTDVSSQHNIKYSSYIKQKTNDSQVKSDEQRELKKNRKIEERRKVTEKEEAKGHSKDTDNKETEQKKQDTNMVESSSNQTLSSFLSLLDNYGSTEDSIPSDSPMKATSTETEHAEISSEHHASESPSNLSLEPLELGQAPECSWDANSIEEFKQLKSSHSSAFSQHTEIGSIFSKSQPSTPLGSHYHIFDERSSFGPLTPSTPIFEDSIASESSQKDGLKRTTVTYYKSNRNNSNGSPVTADQIKIKILLNNQENDIIALKIKRTNLISILYLKKLISFKIYKDYSLINHYSLQVKGINREMDDDELMEHIKSQTKVNLKLTRQRS